MMKREDALCSVSTRSSPLLLLPPPPSPSASALSISQPAGPPCIRRHSVPSLYPCAGRGLLLPAGGTPLGPVRAGAQRGRRREGGRGEATTRRTKSRRMRFMHVHQLLCALPSPHNADPSRVPAAPPASMGRHQEAPRPCSSSPPPPSPPPTCRCPPCLTSCPPPHPRRPNPAGGKACRLAAARQVTVN